MENSIWCWTYNYTIITDAAVPVCSIPDQLLTDPTPVIINLYKSNTTLIIYRQWRYNHYKRIGWCRNLCFWSKVGDTFNRPITENHIQGLSNGIYNVKVTDATLYLCQMTLKQLMEALSASFKWWHPMLWRCSQENWTQLQEEHWMLLTTTVKDPNLPSNESTASTPNLCWPIK
jgi:hypothetical protein